MPIPFRTGSFIPDATHVAENGILYNPVAARKLEQRIPPRGSIGRCSHGRSLLHLAGGAAAEALDEIKVTVDLDEPIARLSVALRQFVEIDMFAPHLRADLVVGVGAGRIGIHPDATVSHLERIDDYRWLIPRSGAMRVDGLIFATEKLMQSIGEQCSLAIDNAMMFAALKRRYETLVDDFNLWFEHSQSYPQRGSTA